MSDKVDKSQVDEANAQNGQAEASAPKKKFGVSKDTVAKAGIPIPPPRTMERRTEIFPNSIEYPLCNLAKVLFDPKKEAKRQSGTEEVPVVIFVFTSTGGKQFTHIEWNIEEDDPKFEEKANELCQRAKHIFDETIGASKFVEGSMSGDTIPELLENIAKAFNAHFFEVKKGEETKKVPLFYQDMVYLKLTYYKGNLQIPKFPNFIQRAFVGNKQLPCEMVINPKYDAIVPQAVAAKNASSVPYSGTATNNSFGDGDLNDFPEI